MIFLRKYGMLGYLSFQKEARTNLHKGNYMPHPISTPSNNARLVPALRADVAKLQQQVAVLMASADDVRASLIPGIKAKLSVASQGDPELQQQLDELREKLATLEFLEQRIKELEAKAKKSDAFANDLLTAQNAARSAQEQIQSFSDRLLAVEVKVEAHDASIGVLKSWRHDIVDPKLNRLESEQRAMAKAIAVIRSSGSSVSHALFAGLAIGTFLVSWWIVSMLLDKWSTANQMGLAGLVTVVVMLLAMVAGSVGNDNSTTTVAAGAAASASTSTGTSPVPPAPVPVTTPPSGGGGTPTQVQPVVAARASAAAGARSS